MARSKTQQNLAQAQMQTSNKALHLALLSAQKRGLLNGDISYQTARQVSICSAKYYLALTGQMSREELKTAIEAVFNYEQADGITAV